VTLYLLDTNVLRVLGPNGHRNVLIWRRTVDDAAFRIRVMTLHEMRRGWEVKKRVDPGRAADGLAKVAALEAVIVAEWARLVGEKDKHRDDMALAATCRVRGFVLVTRNIADFRGRGVRVLDPFKARPGIVTV
jgi:predicted nucleic acid-binding protein